MPHQTVRLAPGVDQNRTPTLNEAAISDTQLVRFIPDRQGMGLVQKLGGWTKFYPNNVNSVPRALWAWDDTASNSYLGVGCESRRVVITGAAGNGTTATLTYTGSARFNSGDVVVVSGVTPNGFNGTYTVTGSTATTISYANATVGPLTVEGVAYSGDGLSIILDGVRQIITPSTRDQSVPVSFSTVKDSNVVVVNATNSFIHSGDGIWIRVPISVGGLILFGSYVATRLDDNSFSIKATTILGANAPATSTVTNGGVSPKMTISSGSSVVTVELPNHGYEKDDTFAALVSTSLGGATIFGNYIISEIVSANEFKIKASTEATSNVSTFMGNHTTPGYAYFRYYEDAFAVPPNTGYGIGGYGAGGYGTGVAPTLLPLGNPIHSSDWTLDNWGEIFMGCPVGGAIYEWNPSERVTRASVVDTAPLINDGCFVAMPQRQLIAWGSTFDGIQDPLLIRWSDANDYTSWTDSPTNQAGAQRISKGSRIVACMQGPQQGLVWTDLALWSMQYVGPPFIYQLNEIANGCGLIGRKAACTFNNVVYWMGQSQFYRMAGSGVEPIRCPVWDVIFQDLDADNLDRIRVAPNSRFGEISWFYPTTTSGGEIAKYVKYNVILDVWDFGTLGRTAWINQSVLGPPIGGSPNGFIYQHETSTDADNIPMTSNFTTGFYSMADGEMKMFVDQVWPDFKYGYYGGDPNADLTLTFYVTDYPTVGTRTYGPFVMNYGSTFITPRFRGRLVSFKVESSDAGSFWRIGGMRYRVQPDGKF